MGAFFKSYCRNVAGPSPQQFSLILGTLFREARERAGLSQKQLSAISGVGRTGIVTLEAGHRIPSMLTCMMLADGLKINLSNSIEELERRLKGQSK